MILVTFVSNIICRKIHAEKSLTVPYNFDVKYKWNQFELGQVDKNVVPVKEEIVVPLLDAIRRVWIDPYVAEFGSNFFKQYSPKLSLMLFDWRHFYSSGPVRLLALTTCSEKRTLLLRTEQLSEWVRLFFRSVHPESYRRAARRRSLS